VWPTVQTPNPISLVFAFHYSHCEFQDLLGRFKNIEREDFYKQVLRVKEDALSIVSFNILG
jgi:hypothetical protein